MGRGHDNLGLLQLPLSSSILSSILGCVPLLWAFVLQVGSKYHSSCDHIHVLAKSRDICPLSTSVSTSSSLIQVSHSNSPFSSHIMMIGSSWSHKDINNLFMWRTPQSHSMPKSGNVCGRCYTHHPWKESTFFGTAFSHAPQIILPWKHIASLTVECTWCSSDPTLSQDWNCAWYH